jgi:hypothetical protein
MRVHRHHAAADLGNLAQHPAFAFGLLLDEDHVAARQHFGWRIGAGALSVHRVAQRPAHVVGRDRSRLSLLDDLARSLSRRLQADLDAGTAGFQNHAQPPLRNVAEVRHVRERHAPVVAGLDLRDRPPEAAQGVVAHQAVVQRLAGDELHVGI